MIELSVIIPVLNKASDLETLAARLHAELTSTVDTFEIIIVTESSNYATLRTALSEQVRVVLQDRPEYGYALRQGLLAARGHYIVTLDADAFHDPRLFRTLWEHRDEGDVIVATRSSSLVNMDAKWSRRSLSIGLNAWLRILLDIDLPDFTSGFRLYRSEVIRSMEINETDAAVLVETIIRAYTGGWRVVGLPLHHKPRMYEDPYADLFDLGMEYLRTSREMWKLRNSISCADYDARAYDSRIPPQRYWQRRRYDIITRMAAPYARTLDIGCGSTRILDGLKDSVTGLDIQLNKLRYARLYNVPLVNADIFCLPFASASFDCVICSEVIEHIPAEMTPFTEMLRVLRPGGCLVLGTPDYDRLLWRMIERVYAAVISGGYAEEHITHYTQSSVLTMLESLGMRIQETAYVFGSELIVKALKPPNSDLT